MKKIKLPNFPIKNLTIFFLIFLVITTLMGTFYTVKTGEVSIISRFGKITRVDTEGLNFKLPFIESSDRMTIRDQAYSFNGSPNNGGNGLVVSTKDMQTVELDIVIQCNIIDPELLYRTFKGRHEASFIIPRVNEKTQANISKYTIEEFISKRKELSDEIFLDLKQDFEKYGILVSNVSIVNHDFSDEYEIAIEQKKVAEQAVERTRFEQEKHRVEAENKVRLAEFQLQERELRAKANTVESTSLSPALLQKMAIEKWNGELPYIQGADTTMFINPEKLK